MPRLCKEGQLRDKFSVTFYSRTPPDLNWDFVTKTVCIETDFNWDFVTKAMCVEAVPSKVQRIWH